MLKSIIYCRVSSVGQQDNYSLETQEAACRQFAEARGLAVQDVIAEVWTGSEFWERPKLNRLRDAIRERRIDAVICYAIDRLSRDIAHLAIFAEECERANVALHFVTESFDDSAEGKLIRSVRGYTAEVERQKIRERCMRGMRARVANGKRPNGSTGLYGYDQDRETTIRKLDPIESEIVKRIWHEALDLGLGANAIARRLNAEGIPCPGAKKKQWKDSRDPKWAKSTILMILKNPSYAGLTYAFRYGKKRVNGKEAHYERPRSEWVILPDSMTPPIITVEQFNSMQRELKARIRSADGTRNMNRPVLLRGFIFCARCGRRRMLDQNAYRCPARYSMESGCGSANTPRKAIEDRVWSEVSKILAEPSLIQTLIDQANSDKSDDGTATAQRAAAIENQIADNRRKQQRLLSRFADAEDHLSEIIETQIRALAENTKKLSADLEELKNRIEFDSANSGRIAELIQLMDGFPSDGSETMAERRALFEAFGLRVETDGRVNWRISLRLVEAVSSGLNLQIYSAENPVCRDGRAERFSKD